VITGASRGLGRAMAEGFAAEGARLVLTATRAGHLEAALEACRRAGADAAGVVLDLDDAASVDAAAADAVAELGRVDALVNNAGVLGPRAEVAEVAPEAFERVMRVNVTHTLRLIQRILPAMADGGAIVNLTSGASGRPARWGGYGVSKAALEAVTLALRAELAPRSIRCVAVNPGPARTAMRAAAYPDEDPATVPHPSSLVEPVLAIVAGADPGPRIEAREWRG
jgi:NAD(P)-dependent dehydrogenase (short-subunit alcohol dehydrogenase family)